MSARTRGAGVRSLAAVFEQPSASGSPPRARASTSARSFRPQPAIPASANGNSAVGGGAHEGQETLKDPLDLATRSVSASRQAEREEEREALLTGFVANQQKMGEQPNASKFYLQVVSSILLEGLQIHPKIANAVMRTVVEGVESQKKPAHLLIDDLDFLSGLQRQMGLFLREQRGLKSVITLQSAARRWLVMKRVQSQGGENLEATLRRNERFLEIFRTEKKFVASLKELIERFMNPTRHSGILEPHECAYIFSNIETIHSEHEALCQRLEEAQATWPVLGNVGAIFLDIKPLLNAISSYVSHFQTSINEISRQEEINPSFKEFLAGIHEKTEVDLPTALLLPVNRISQYEFYLRGLADELPPGTQEHGDCENAFAALAQSSLLVQQCLVESSNAASLLAVQQKLRTEKGPLSIHMPGRMVIAEFTFKKFYVCLFSDALLLAEVNSRAHKVKCIVPYRTTELFSDSKRFELKIGEIIHKLIPVQPEHKEEFTRAYRRILEEINRIKVFGVPMIETIIREERDSGVPVLIEILTKFIEENALEQAGIFRVAGSGNESKGLQALFDAGELDPAHLKLDSVSIFSVCDVLKQYFRSLPEPMLGYRLYDPIVSLMRETIRDDSQRIHQIQEAILHWTPPFAIKVLRFLMAFLHRVAECSEENKMNSTNLSIVFGPTLLWAERNTLEAAMDMPYINGAVQEMIENYQLILA